MTHGSLSVPLFDAIVEFAIDDAGVLGEPFGDIGIEPAAAIIECRGQIPVIERRERLDTVLEQCVDEPFIERESCGIHAAFSFGQHARPGDAESVGL